ncbi:MAG: SGNH/GDSL hydrolase family protein, partial [bacterium]|nr:SGNH/GDSL hydrolase family protein [bacterium]
MAAYGKKLALGISVTVAFFILIELILLAVGVVPLYQRTDPYIGFSGYAPLFLKHTPSNGEPIFETAQNKIRWFNQQSFPVRKAEGTIRIFCLGGSTTYGRPYDDRTSFCGWLRLFLPAVDPGHRYEVINAGGISYASYRVARLMEELADYEPDLFIVYSGHNEFLEKRTYDKLLKTPAFV